MSSYSESTTCFFSIKNALSFMTQVVAGAAPLYGSDNPPMTPAARRLLPVPPTTEQRCTSRLATQAGTEAMLSELQRIRCHLARTKVS